MPERLNVGVRAMSSDEVQPVLCGRCAIIGRNDPEVVSGATLHVPVLKLALLQRHVRADILE